MCLRCGAGAFKVSHWRKSGVMSALARCQLRGQVDATVMPIFTSQARRLQMKIVKASAVQLSPVLYSRAGTVEKAVRKIHALGQRGVQFATFPQTVVPYYPYFSIVQSGYQIIVGGEFLKLLDQSVTVPSLATEATGVRVRELPVKIENLLVD